MSIKIYPPIKILRELVQREIGAVEDDYNRATRQLERDLSIEKRTETEGHIAGYRERLLELRAARDYVDTGCKSEVASLCAEAELLDAGTLQITTNNADGSIQFLVVVARGAEADAMKASLDADDAVDRDIEKWVAEGNASALSVVSEEARKRSVLLALRSYTEPDILRRIRNRAARAHDLLAQRAPAVIIENERTLLYDVACEYVRRVADGEVRKA